MWKFVAVGNPEPLKELLEDPEITVNHVELDRALIQCCDIGAVECLKLLTDHGADPNAVSKDGHPAVIVATKRGHLRVVEHLIISGCDVEHTDTKEDWTALLHSIDVGAGDIFDRLVEAGAEIWRRTSRGNFALRVACVNDRSDIASKILLYSNKCDKAFQYVNECLHAAAVCGSNSAIGVLLDWGADINSVSEQPESFRIPSRLIDTPLITAVGLNKYSTVSLLITRGADVHVKEELTKKTALHCAAARSVNLSVVQELLAAGADPNAEDLHGNLPLHYAVRKQRHVIVKELLKSGSKFDIGGTRTCAPHLIVPYSGMNFRYYASEASWTPIKIALFQNDWPLVELLLGVGVCSPSEFLQAVERYENQARKVLEGRQYIRVESLDTICVKYCSSPYTLGTQCRTAICQTLSHKGGNFKKSVNSLPLPELLKQFLMFSHI